MNLNVECWEVGSESADLGHHVPHELLAPEARLHRHHQHLVHQPPQLHHLLHCTPHQ